MVKSPLGLIFERYVIFSCFGYPFDGCRLFQAPSKEDMVARIRQHAPFEWFNNRSNIRTALDEDFPNEKPAYQSKYTKEDFPNLPRCMKDWAEQYIEGECGPRPKTLVVWGPSRTGKTQWARSLGEFFHVLVILLV